MYIYIYVYIYMCVCVRVSVCVCVRVCIFAFRRFPCLLLIHIHTYPTTYLHTYIHTCIYTYLHTYIPTSLHTYIPTYLHAYIPTYGHTDTLTYVHTDIQTYGHTDIETCRHADMQTYTHKHLQRYRHTDIHTHTNVFAHTHTYTYTYIYIYINEMYIIYIYTWIKHISMLFALDLFQFAKARASMHFAVFTPRKHGPQSSRGPSEPGKSGGCRASSWTGANTFTPSFNIWQICQVWICKCHVFSVFHSNGSCRCGFPTAHSRRRQRSAISIVVRTCHWSFLPTGVGFQAGNCIRMCKSKPCWLVPLSLCGSSLTCLLSWNVARRNPRHVPGSSEIWSPDRRCPRWIQKPRFRLHSSGWGVTRWLLGCHRSNYQPWTDGDLAAGLLSASSCLLARFLNVCRLSSFCVEGICEDMWRPLPWTMRVGFIQGDVCWCGITRWNLGATRHCGGRF